MLLMVILVLGTGSLALLDTLITTIVSMEGFLITRTILAGLGFFVRYVANQAILLKHAGILARINLLVPLPQQLSVNSVAILDTLLLIVHTDNNSRICRRLIVH